MRYYYGNSYEEAIGNPPIEIKTVKKLQQYEKFYSFVIPVNEIKRENMNKPKLTAEEKRQLERELRPIKDVVKYLYRYQYSDRDCGAECFDVILINDFVISDAFCETANRAYMGVGRDRYYTLEELGLFKEEN